MPTVAHLPERARRGEAALTGLGYRVSYGRHAMCVSADGMTAGSPQQRAVDLMEAFEDPTVDAVLAADAGTGSRDLMEFLEGAVLAANPKPFIGYCDNVYINQYLATHAQLSSLYGCTLMAHLGEAGGPYPETLDYLVTAMTGRTPLVCVPVPDRTGEFVNWYVPGAEGQRRHRSVPGGWTWIRRGRASGHLVGGEIRLIPDLIDRLGLPLESAVLFWHIAFDAPPAESLFRRLCASGDMSRLAGMVVGAHPAVAPAEWAATVSDLIDELLPDIGYPLVVNADISHLDPAWTVPYGEEVLLDSSCRADSSGGIVFGRGARPADSGIGR